MGLKKLDQRLAELGARPRGYPSRDRCTGGYVLMKTMFYPVSLTTEELVLLDGRVRPEVQKEIDKAKEAKALETFVGDAAQARFIADAV